MDLLDGGTSSECGRAKAKRRGEADSGATFAIFGDMRGQSTVSKRNEVAASVLWGRMW
jgi:hypothetical protein